MARIRTVKPEFPQSESLGRVSRDARLCFVNLWTICDDAGRARGNSRMLASLLFPYDDDAPKLIDGWMAELEREEAIVRYEADGNSYVSVVNWLKHQKIDKPSVSKLPAPREASRIISKPREASSEDLGPRTKDLDQGPGREGTKEGTNARSACADEIAQAIEAYNLAAERQDWPIAQHLSEARRKKLAGRLRECGGLQGWQAAMAKAQESSFLRGEGVRDKAHANWVPDLDFFLQQSTFSKLMEGKYDDRAGRSEPTGFAAVIAGARAAAA